MAFVLWSTRAVGATFHRSGFVPSGSFPGHTPVSFAARSSAPHSGHKEHAASHPFTTQFSTQLDKTGHYRTGWRLRKRMQKRRIYRQLLQLVITGQDGRS